MTANDFTSDMQLSHRSAGRALDLDDNEIERAIREINAAIHKFDKR